MKNVTKKYIEDALNELASSFGIREPVNQKKLLGLVRKGEIDSATQKVCSYLGLPVQVNISYVSSEESSDADNGFSSKDVVEVKPEGENPVITAQVAIPPNLPFFGTDGMEGFTINVRVSENCTDYPATFITVIAHELSHIVLHSMRHKRKENEVFTDLTAMVLGFHKVMRAGRKVEEVTNVSKQRFNSKVRTRTEKRITTYGYLSDENFDFASRKIDQKLQELRQLKRNIRSKLTNVETYIEQTKGLKSKSEKYLNHLNQRPPKDIPSDDAKKFAEFNQSGYKDEVQKNIAECENDIEESEKVLEQINTYNDQNKERLKELEKQTEEIVTKIKQQQKTLQEDIELMQKHSGFLFWLMNELFSKTVSLSLEKGDKIQQDKSNFVKAQRVSKNNQDEEYSRAIISAAVILAISIIIFSVMVS